MKGWWRGRRERIEKGSRERIEIERGTEQFEEEDKEHQHLPLLVVQLPQGTVFLLSSPLDSAVKRCSSEVSVSSRAACYRVWPEETSEVLIRSEVVGVAKVANN